MDGVEIVETLHSEEEDDDDAAFTIVECEDGDQDNLLAAAAHLDRQMRAIQQAGRVIGHERCAIMAALNTQDP